MYSILKINTYFQNAAHFPISPQLYLDEKILSRHFFNPAPQYAGREQKSVGKVKAYGLRILILPEGYYTVKERDDRLNNIGFL